MTKKELLEALTKVDDKEQELRTRAIEEMGTGSGIDDTSFFKMLDYAEATAIKAHEAIEWIKQMIDENFGEEIE